MKKDYDVHDLVEDSLSTLKKVSKDQRPYGYSWCKPSCYNNGKFCKTCTDANNLLFKAESMGYWG